jgi:hypothetical protein
MRTPIVARASAVSSVSHGCDDEVSISIDPAASAAISPSPPVTTSRTTLPSGSIVITMSDSAARWASDEATAMRGSAAASAVLTAASMSNTVNG